MLVFSYLQTGDSSLDATVAAVRSKITEVMHHTARDCQRVRNTHIMGGTPFDVSPRYGLNISCTCVCSSSFATRCWLLGQLLATMSGLTAH